MHITAILSRDEAITLNVHIWAIPSQLVWADLVARGNFMNLVMYRLDHIT